MTDQGEGKFEEHTLIGPDGRLSRSLTVRTRRVKSFGSSLPHGKLQPADDPRPEPRREPLEVDGDDFLAADEDFFAAAGHAVDDGAGAALRRDAGHVGAVG